MKHSLYLFAVFALLFGNVGAKRSGMAPVNSVCTEKASVNASKDKVSKLPQDELYVIDENGEEHQMTPEELATEIEKKGKLVFTSTPFRRHFLFDKSGAAHSKKHPELDMNGVDMDHKQDLQLGGKDTLRNIAPLDSGVNRSIGAQIRQAKENLPEGTSVKIRIKYLDE